MRSVLGHELLGHGVQNLEQGQTPGGKLTGWSIGGNPNLFLKEIAREGTPQHDIYQRLRSSASKPISFEEYADMLKGSGLEATEKSYNNFLEATNKFGVSGPVDDRLRQLAAHETYRKGAGEAAARAIQERMDFGPRKIQQVPFEQSLDVPINEQLFVPRPPLKPRLEPQDTSFLGSQAMGSLADQSRLQLSDVTNFNEKKALKNIAEWQQGAREAMYRPALTGDALKAAIAKDRDLPLPANQNVGGMPRPIEPEPMGSLADTSKLQLSAKAPTGFAPGSVLGTGKTLASPKEITRAAAESRKGMTQPELRELYDQLGLTGRAPSELVSKSLAAKQPTSLVEEATRIKLADREVLDTLTGQQRLDYQKSGKLPGGVLLPSQEAALPGLEKFAPVKKEVARAEKEFDKAGSRVGDLFDLSPKTLMKTPNVPQYPLPRIAPKVTERLEPVAKGGLARLERAAAAAPEENWGWYNLMQQRDLMHQLHGPQKGEQAFNAWLDGLAGTSMVNPIDNNIRSSTWYLQQVLQGKPLPEVLHIADPETGKMVKTMAGGPPPGYGAKSQIQHADRVREYMTHTYDPVTNPKPISYRTNLSGNYGPRTVDTHDIRNMVGMPLAKKLFSAEDSALLPGEYSHLEDVGARAAKRAGTAQAPQQAATWVGGGEYTGLKSYPAPLAEAINRRAHVTAKVRGITPEQALEDAFTGKMPLLGIGGAAIMGGLAAQDEYR